MKGKKPLLLIEDDRVDQITVRRALKDINVTNLLIIVSNGEEALEFLRNEKNEKPSIILLDLNMPKMNGIEFLNLLKAKFRTKPRDDWIKICRDKDLIAAPVNNFREVSQDPDVLANKYITEVDHPVAGKIPVVGLPYFFSETPGRIGVAPALGQHNEEILTQLGYTAAQIRELREKKVI